MDWIYSAAVIVVIAVLLIWVGLRDRYQIVAKPLLTRNEVHFYHLLLQALPDFAVMTQVSMGAYLKPACSPNSRNYWRTRNKFGQKISDFVICDSQSLEILVVIELDDRMHDAQKDAARDQMLAKAGIETLPAARARRR